VAGGAPSDKIVVSVPEDGAASILFGKDFGCVHFCPAESNTFAATGEPTDAPALGGFTMSQ
jgi:hypothetical protein